VPAFKINTCQHIDFTAEESFGREVLNRIDVEGDPVNLIDPWGLMCCNPDGTVNTNGECCKDRPGSEKAGAWAQYQFHQGNKNYTKAANTCGGTGENKCNCFVADALRKGGGLDRSQLPNHYNNGKKTEWFARANELADISKNTDVLGIGDGSIGDIIAWENSGGPGHTGIVGCDGKIYSAGGEELYQWNNRTYSSWQQIVRYSLTGRKKVIRRLK
jgi:hypothetical protein